MPATDRLGFALGGVAVLFWSFASLLIFLGVRQAGTWSFVTLASVVGGVTQLIGWRLSGHFLKQIGQFL